MSAVAKIIITPASEPGFMNVFARPGSAVARVAANDAFIGADAYAAATTGSRFIPYVGLAIAVGLTAYEIYSLLQNFGSPRKLMLGWTPVGMSCPAPSGINQYQLNGGAVTSCPVGAGDPNQIGSGRVPAGYAVPANVNTITGWASWKPGPAAIPSWWSVTAVQGYTRGLAGPLAAPYIAYWPDVFAEPDPNLNPRLNPQPRPARFPEGDPVPSPTEQPSPGLEPQGEPGPVGNSQQEFMPDGSVRNSTNPDSWPRPRPESDPAKNQTKERKVRSKGPLMWAILDGISESAEVVNSFYDTLPADVRKKWDKIGKESRKGQSPLADTAGQYGISNADWQLRALFYNWDKVDLIEALGNVAYNEVEDKVVGNVAKRLPKTNGPLLKPVLDEYGKVSKQWREDFKDVVLVGNR